MLNVIRYSQIVDLVAIDEATSDYLGPIQEVWVNDDGRISYLSSPKGYIPLLQVAGIGTQAVSVRARPEELAKAPAQTLHRLQKLPVLGTPDASEADAAGWVEDFLFDWQTGEVTLL